MRVTQTKQVTVLGVIAVTVSVPSRAYSGISVTISASWDTAAGPFDGVCYFGDGLSEIINTTTKSTSKAHIYATVGSYVVKVVVKDRNTGAQGEGTAPIQITDKLSATLYPSPDTGDAPLPVSFSIGISGGYTPYSWTLDYGDGTSPGSGSSPGTNTHTYTKVGTFNATLTVTDALGATIASRSKVMSGVTAITPLVSILAPLAVGAALIKVVGR